MEHISYSQYNSYTRCPRSWYLSKIQHAEEKQTWYIPIGTAVHSMIEDYLSLRPLGAEPESRKVEAYFYPLIEKQMQIEPDLSKWLAGGPESDPITHERALQRALECYERAVQELEQVDVWEVEYDASGRLPGLDVPIKAYVDIIGKHKKKGPVILDWKTGTTKPDNFQLQTYAALLDGHYDLGAPWSGRYVMLAPGAANTRYVDLSAVDPAEVGKKYQRVYTQMQKKIYKAEPGFGCRFCFNQDNCLANKGPNPRTQYYDRSAEHGLPY